ncbi:MAG: biotin carboxylase N-terminal domain-containing protein [Pseudomonadota bacterium]
MSLHANSKLFNSILIANRGEIACRIARTARALGIKTIAVHSDADRNAPHVKVCDEAIRIGPAPAAESYLVIEKIVNAAQISGADAVHPGYGFLSENADFASALEAAGIVFIGPRPETIQSMGSKAAAKDLMAAAGVPITPGYQGDDQSTARFLSEAEAIGYPVLLKASAGGGGKGMRLVEAPGHLAEALEAAKREALSAFGDDRFILEKFVPRARHVEVQIFGDGEGGVVHVFERDCSVQRRHQKILEEAPAPNLPEDVRQKLLSAAVDAGRAIKYRGAGTVEFLYDGADAFYFMEMNTRLQVEHPVSEAITGLDFVDWQLRIVAGQGLPLSQSEIQATGAAIEARLYAEDPQAEFTPSTGVVEDFVAPENAIRLDAGVEIGSEITPYYDPMIAKIIAHGSSREEALHKLRKALESTVVSGLQTNLSFLHALSSEPAFVKGDFSTALIEDRGAELLAAPPISDAALAASAFAHSRSVSTAVWPEETTGFRLNENSRRAFWMHTDGETYRCALTSIGQFGHEKFELTLEANARASERGATQNATPPKQAKFSAGTRDEKRVAITIGAERQTYYLAQHKGGVRIFANAQHWDVSFPSVSADTQASSIADGGLTSPLPGVLTGTLVEPGASVEAGAPLATIEAMKMEHTLKAPEAGRVNGYRFQEGDQLREGDLIVDFSPTHP